MSGLLFYDPLVGEGEFYTTRNGRIGRTRLHLGWRTGWRQIIPGHFGGPVPATRPPGFTDLLFYEPSTGTGEFYTTDDRARIRLLATHTNWRSSWTQIIPGNFGGSGFTDLLFYDAAGNTGEFYTTDGQGGISQLATHTNWRSSWTQIIPGDFGGSGFTDLLFYDAAGNTGEFYTTDGQGGISQLATHTNWRSSWTQIIPSRPPVNGTSTRDTPTWRSSAATSWSPRSAEGSPMSPAPSPSPNALPTPASTSPSTWPASNPAAPRATSTSSPQNSSTSKSSAATFRSTSVEWRGTDSTCTATSPSTE